MGLALWQSILSGLILLVISALFKKRLWQGLKFLGLCAFIAVCGYIIPGIIYYYAAVHVQAGILSITITLVPLLTYGFSIPLRLEKPTFKRMTGLILGTAAILFIVIPQGSLPDPSDIPWILLACLGSAFYALESIIISAKMPMKQSPVVVACVSNFIAVILLAPIVFGTGKFFILNWPLDSAGRAIIGVSVISMLAYTLYIYVIKHSGPLFASQTAYIVTLSGVFWGMAIFGEVHSNWVWISLITMLAGLALVTPRKDLEEKRI